MQVKTIKPWDIKKAADHLELLFMHHFVLFKNNERYIYT